VSPLYLSVTSTGTFWQVRALATLLELPLLLFSTLLYPMVAATTNATGGALTQPHLSAAVSQETGRITHLHWALKCALIP
jgi:hypothetical protein